MGDRDRATKPKQASNLAREPRLTKEQLDAWKSFTAAAWSPFKKAWLERGFLWPPSGDPDDDDTSRRGLLWQIADARPHDLGRWVKEAPAGATVREVIDYALERWHAIRTEVGVEEETLVKPDTRSKDRDALASIQLRALTEAPLVRAVRRMGEAAYDFLATTHGDGLGHDHHCPVTDDKIDDACTCGWSNLLKADDELAVLHPERFHE